ncbi:MAG TPA: TonB-dependent receptor [Chitinophagaceae bacterium]|nr:TonB-dependent receptor [Chitinophagaceae bacterium]
MRKSAALLLAVLLFTAQILWAQNKTVSGKITDSKDGSPIVGATILVKGTRSGTVTGQDGSFSLSVPESATTLVISALGFDSQEVGITGAPVQVALRVGETRSLDEVVVVGFGTKIKRDLTGNIARVKGNEVANLPVPNLTQALQGRAAGVFVEANNGKVGEGVKVRIRGAGSISAANDPLYVVDGIPINTGGLSGNALADINFNDIETFDILKDASAAAIYGSRAAGGVVLITTKKGRAGKTNLAVNMQYGTNKPTNYRGFLDAKEYVDLLREAAINSDIIEGVDPLDPAQYPGSWLEFAENRLTRYSGYSNWRNLETNTNWEKLAFNDDSKTKIVDVTASGGNEKTRFYISGGFHDQEGILILNDFQRISSRFNLEHDASDKIRLGFNLSVSRTVGNRNNLDNAFQTPMQLVALAPITPPKDQNGNYYDRPVTTYYNGLIELDNSVYKSTTIRNIGNLFLAYRLVKGLTFRTEVGIDIQTQNDELFRGSKTLTGLSTNGYGQSDWLRNITLNTNNYFNYIKTLGGKHDIDAILGMSYQKYNTDFTSVWGEDFPVDALQKLASAGRITGGTSSLTESSIVSYFTRGNYKFDDKYLASISLRVDGSSRFGRNNQYGFFPAFSAGWIITEEKFLDNSKWLSFLKLRGSYGLTGNDGGFGNFSQLGLYGASKYNNQSGLIPTQLANPELKWERSKQMDIGIDFGLFSNRLTGEVDYYVRKTDDLIYSVPVPGTSGFSTQLVNVGSMENTGFEVVLNSTNIKGKDFTWNTSFNIAKNKNEITKLDGDQTSIPGNDGRYLNSLIVGEAIGVFYGPKFAGADPDNGDALYYEEDGKTLTNDYNDAGNFVVGDPNPDWIGGLSNNFSYKGFELNVLFQGVFGNQIMDGAGGFMSASFDWFDNQTRDQLRRWQKPGDITDVPQLRLGYGNGIQASTRYIQDGSYVRLKNVTLAYNIPSSVLNKIKLRSARLYVTGVNLATFTDYTGWDPEVNTDYRAGNRNQGGDFYAAPQIKSITFGINLGF